MLLSIILNIFSKIADYVVQKKRVCVIRKDVRFYKVVQAIRFVSIEKSNRLSKITSVKRYGIVLNIPRIFKAIPIPIMIKK